METKSSKSLLITLLVCLSLLSSSIVKAAEPDKKPDPKIQVALLLDTSGSMSGLIEQAKSQLWKIVNELATAKQDGITPTLELSLYEYGKSSIPQEQDYIKQIVPLTTDLDLVSEELFKLQTNGGDEYCGAVIDRSTKELSWSSKKDDLKMIFIAGNEPFTQGSVDYKKACKAAITNNIVVNTIFCGDHQEGINTQWKDGADRGEGKYMHIDHNQATVYIDAPQDTKIAELNTKLNDTYIGYGSAGVQKKERQAAQDANAATYGSANVVQRAASKSSAAYDASGWDLVDASEDESFDFEEIEEEELPAELKGKSSEEIEAIVEEKRVAREKIQNEINALYKERETFVAEKRKEMSKDNSLEGAMLDAIRSQAKDRNFKFE